jgi:hypothetical protein
MPAQIGWLAARAWRADRKLSAGAAKSQGNVSAVLRAAWDCFVSGGK